MPNRPDDGDDEVDAVHQLVDAQGEADAARHGVHADRGDGEAEEIDTRVLTGGAPPTPTKLEKARK